MIARMTLAGIRNELDTLHRHTGMTITIERTDKDGNADAAGRYVNVIVPSGVTQTGIITKSLNEARNTIRQYLAQAGIVPSTDTFPANNLTAAVAAHHRRFVASLNDPQPEPPATTIDIASKYGTFTYQMVAWRCADRSNGLASYPTWHETLDAHEWLDYRPLTTDRIKRIVTTWPAQNIVTVELDNGYWFQVRYEPMPAPDYAAIPAIGGGSHEADIFTAKLDNGTIIATGDHATVDDAALHYVSGPLVQLTPGGHWQASYVKRGIRCSVYAPDGTRLARYFNAWQAEDTGMVYGPAFAPTPNATIPAIGGGSHEADTTPEPEYIVSLTSGNEVSLVTRNGGVIHWKHLSDAIQSARNLMHTDNGRAYTGYAVIEMPANATVAQWSVNDSYADLPPIGGGSHEAATQPTKPRNVATSQKRDNQRAARAALNEAYKAHAAGKASEVSDILTAFGFAIISTKDNDGTPVTIWRDTNPQEIEGTNPDHIAHATIKQTPYSLRIYNGQPARLPRHGDAELINRVEHGWCIGPVEPRGYAAGLADAILRLIEVPDPLMEAMEAREAEQSAPLPELVLHGGQPSMSGPWQAPAISGGSQDAETCAECGNALRPYEQGAGHGTCFACQSARAHALDCQHDADEPPARFCSQCGHDRTPNAPQPTDTGTSYDVPEIVESVFLAHEDARDEGEYRAIIAEQNRTAWDSINQQLDAMHDAAKQRMIDADAFIKQAGDARASALHGMLTANAHHFKPHARAYEAAMMDADAALTAARTIKRMTTSQDTELSHEDFAATLDALDALRLMGMRPAQSIIDRLLALRVFRAFYERHRTARKFTITTEERQNNRQAIGAPNITTARRIARNLTGCGITNSATIHEERANNTSILRETWHQAHKLTGDELTAFISPLAFA